jgi:hypothetical protein
MSPTRRPLGKGVGALPGGVVHQIPVVITEEGAAGEMARVRHLGRLRFAALESESIRG